MEVRRREGFSRRVFMNIAGLEKNSFVDFPGKIAAVIFLQGCNFDCYFCHNRGLLSFEEQAFDETGLWEFLRRRRGLLDGVVVSGGEPTLQSGLAQLLRDIRELDFATKLDTNGSRPETLRNLLSAGLLDYVALDVKAPAARYEEVAGKGAAFPLEALEALRQWAGNWEVRTTCLPQFGDEDVQNILREIKPVPCYVLQAYRMPGEYKPEDRFRVSARPHMEEELRRFAHMAQSEGLNVSVRV